MRPLTTALALMLATVTAAAADTTGGLLPVPAVTIERGQTVSADMLTEKHFYYDPARPLAVLTDPSTAIGREARRSLSPGRPIPLNAFRTALLVTRGKLTEARFRMGNLTITATVLAQGDGGAGDLVQARNVDTGRTIAGIVALDGTLEVSAP